MNRGTERPGDDREAAAPSFSDLLAGTVSEAVDANRKSESISIRAASGQSDLQDVVEAVNAAEISLQTVISIRDRVISAYQEIMRMPI
ncbi:MAG: flagellar hook-basal body complex protein FliE [Rhizobiales bacterium]|nr:flagellar hook-basal body complex protein FliE [Hyphomicrobiales bacterium]